MVLFSLPAKRLLAHFACVLLFVVANLAALVGADEVILDDRTIAPTSLGDFYCEPCFESTPSFDLSRGEITAGELWQYFKDQGINTLDHLIFSVDVIPQETDAKDFKLDQVVLTIQDPDDPNAVITNMSLDRGGDNLLVLPGQDVTSYKPEAQMQINLGYDFMKQFRPDSTEIVKLNIAAKDGTPIYAKIGIIGQPNYFPKFLFLVGFVIFWIVVFAVLCRFTLPENRTKQGAASA